MQSAGDDVPRVDGILERVQIDHTVIDVIVVDERERQPVGRPYLSIGLDEASRCAVGMVVTVEPPSATSVGLCLAHMACDKQPWLQMPPNPSPPRFYSAILGALGAPTYTRDRTQTD